MLSIFATSRNVSDVVISTDAATIETSNIMVAAIGICEEESESSIRPVTNKLARVIQSCLIPLF